MEVSLPVLALLVATTALNVGHVAIHVMTTLVRRSPRLPWYDAWVGYLGALVWFLLVLLDRGTLDWSWKLAVPPGLALTAVGLYVHGRGIRDIMAHGGEGLLVTQGIYARLRHPIYYGWVIVSFGLPLVTGSWWGLVTAPVWSVLIILVGLMEERDMRRRFPEGEFEEYARSTWF
jgi:protein-S-isoprenylcysteine O-methyltransferase Ste14